MVGEDHLRGICSPAGAGKCRAQLAEEFRRRLDTGQSRPDDERSISPSRGRLPVEGIDVVVEPRGALVSIDIERELWEPGNIGADQPAAEGKHQPVIVQEMAGASDRTGNLSIIEVDVGDLARHPLEPDRLEDIVERDPHPT
jgi:hypothetical protein